MCLILLICSIQLAIGAEIITFSATLFNIPTITNDSITLHVELSNCSSSCSCHVQTNKTGDLASVSFFPNTTKGFVTIKNLQPYTLYSFDINCSEVMSSKNYAIRTDVFRPLSPRNIELILNNKRLQLKWMPPSLPQGPIDEYRVTVDKIEMKPALKNTVLSYTMNKDYISGITHTMSVSACNIDTQNRTLCSNPKDAEASYFQKKIDTTLPTQTASVNQISFMFILLIQTFVYHFPIDLLEICCMSVYIFVTK